MRSDWDTGALWPCLRVQFMVERKLMVSRKYSALKRVGDSGYTEQGWSIFIRTIWY